MAKREIPPEPMVMLLRLKADGTVERCMPHSEIVKWREWKKIPDYISPDDYAAGLREMGLEVQWLAM